MTNLVVNFDRLDFEQDSVGDALLDGEYFTGVAFEEVNGVVLAVIGYMFGKRHGAIREWYPTGAARDEEYLNSGAPHGPTRRWHRNGQIAESGYSQRFTRLRHKAWDENGKLVEDVALSDASKLDKLDEESQRAPRPVIDIDLATLTPFERSEGWGREETELPPPQRAPSLGLCRALEVQRSAGAR